MSIASEISRILNAKESLKTAINNKGGNITTERIDQFASEVTALPSPKEEETRTLTPDFSSGDVVVIPDAGKVLTQVTLVKDNDLVPENIVKDVEIFGVVGTAETGGVPLEQFITFPTDYAGWGQLDGYRLLTFFSRNTFSWHTDVDIKIYYKNENNEEVLLTSMRTDGTDEVHFIVIPRSYGLLKIVMSLVPDAYYEWGGFYGFYAKTANPPIVKQLTPPDNEEDFVLSYVDFDVFHVVYTAYGD